MQDIFGSVRRSLVFRGSPENEEASSLGVGGSLVDKISYCIRSSRVFSKPSPPPSFSKNAAPPIRWRKGELIGCGAFGQVYVGMNLDSEELLAVKQIVPVPKAEGTEYVASKQKSPFGPTTTRKMAFYDTEKPPPPPPWNRSLSSVAAFRRSITPTSSSLISVTELYSLAVTTFLSLINTWENTPPNWVGSDPCDDWVGIKCKNSHITSITLSSTSLAGQLSGDIGSLSELETLDLSYNKDLNGPLPESIGELKKLATLILVGCSFKGPIPDNIGNMQEILYAVSYS
ncbi:Mitogen-activated protein kinase kinase kinase 3 [Glycine soja]